MFKVEAKIFEQEVEQGKPTESATQNLTKEIQLFLAFFGPKVLDYEIGYSTYIRSSNSICYSALVTVRLREDNVDNWQ